MVVTSTAALPSSAQADVSAWHKGATLPDGGEAGIHSDVVDGIAHLVVPKDPLARSRGRGCPCFFWGRGRWGRGLQRRTWADPGGGWLQSQTP